MAQHILHIISIWIVVLPFVAGIINYKGLNGDSKWIFFTVLCGLAPQIMTYFFFTNGSPWLNIAYNIYTPLEFLFFWCLFKTKFEDKINQTIHLATGLIYLVVSVYFVASLGIKKNFLEFWVCINNLFYLIWIMIFLKEQYNSDSYSIMLNKPFGWYFLSIIIYAPCTILVFCLYHYIRDSNQTELLHLWLIQIICNILLYIFFTIGLFISKKSTKFNDTKVMG